LPGVHVPDLDDEHLQPGDEYVASRRWALRGLIEDADLDLAKTLGYAELI
jgi:hypothetical protein